MDELLKTNGENAEEKVENTSFAEMIKEAIGDEPVSEEITEIDTVEEETEEKILKLLEPDYINGLTLLGGEPFEPCNQRALLPFVKRVRERKPKKSSAKMNTNPNPNTNPKKRLNPISQVMNPKAAKPKAQLPCKTFR